ncbi:hypothetical protein AGMMS49957_18430 [Synergistales bacterium]|nr:hypothetical protein AGMMS49957_18430 [Synergistales bacterium]
MRGSSLFVFVTLADLEEDNHLSPSSLINQTAQIAESAGRKRADIEVVPVAFFYDSWGADAAWGSDVDVFIGETIPLSDPSPDPQFIEELDTAELSARIRDALLEMTGDNRFSRMSPFKARQMAHLASTDGRASYALSLSVLSQLPEHSPLVGMWDVFCGRCEDLGVWRVNDFPVFTTSRPASLIVETVLSAVPAAADFILNIGAFIFVFARLFFMKDRDTDRRRRKRSASFAAAIVPWTVLLWAYFCASGLPWLILPHFLITLSGGYCARLFRVGCAQVVNSVRYPELRGMYERLREELLGVIY